MAHNIPITQDTANPYSESDVRFNYADPRQVIAASNFNDLSLAITPQAQYYSSDHGNTWGQTSLPVVSTDFFQSDPCVDWTSDGTAWAITIGINAFETTLILRSYRSADGGKTWIYDSVVSGIQTSADRPSLWIDHSPDSPYKDYMYVTWHNGGAPAFISVRKGPGGIWSTPFQLSGAETTFTSCGGDVKTNRRGDIFAIWPDAGGRNLWLRKSTNGGLTFDALGTNPVLIGTTFGSFRIFIPAQQLRSAAIYLSGGAWRTDTHDLVYACWADLDGGTGCTAPANQPGSNVASACKTRVWFAVSRDGGATWQPPQKINDSFTLNDQFFARLTVDETNGHLMIVYYDTAADPGRVRADIWMQYSRDHGKTWSNPARITTSGTNEAVGSDDNTNQFGDYIGLTSHDCRYFACWTDRRAGKFEQIWGSHIHVACLDEEDDFSKKDEYTGKVSGVLYDRFGDFEGFTLRTFDGEEHSFRGNEEEMGRLVYRAWEERILITVVVAPLRRDWPAALRYDKTAKSF